MKNVALISHARRFAVLACLGLASCVSVEKAAPPVAQLSAAKPANRARLEAGRLIYTDQCTRCHWPMQIATRPQEKWENDILPVMEKKSKLTPEQSAVLKDYVLAALQPLNPPPPKKN